MERQVQMEKKINAGPLKAGQGILLGILLGVVCLFSACGKEKAVFTAGGQEASGQEADEQEASGTEKEAFLAEGTEEPEVSVPEKQPDNTSEERGSGTDSAQYREAETSEALEAEREESLVVYVCGQVNRPGVYELEPGARIADAVELAGGMTEDAAADVWNLARILADEQMIRIPSREEAKEWDLNAFQESMNAGEKEQEAKTGDGRQTLAKAAGEDGRLSLNEATKEQLMALPGIGSAKADAILEYRQEHGGFGSIEELLYISGIKEGVFAKIKDLITV